MHFEFALDSSDIDLWNIDLLNTHLDLLDTDIFSKHFVSLQDVWKTSTRHVFKTSTRHIFKTSTRHIFKTSTRHIFKTSPRHVFKTSPRHIFKMSSRHVLKKSWRRLQLNNFSFSKTSSEISSRRLGRQKIVTLKTSWRPTNVCWVICEARLEYMFFVLQEIRVWL